MSQSYKDIIQGQLPYKTYKSNDVESRALGKVLDKLQESTDKLELNVNPQTTLKAGLKSWEDFFNLVVNENESIEFRRARVLSELMQYMGDENVITKEEMESIIGLYGGRPQILEYPSEYYFIIEYNNSLALDLRQLSRVLEKVKPSYLGSDFSILSNTIFDFMLTNYEFPNELKVTDLFGTEDKVPGIFFNQGGNLVSKTYEFQVNFGITDIMSTETIVDTDTNIELELENYNPHNKVEFIRPGDFYVGEGEI